MNNRDWRKALCVGAMLSLLSSAALAVDGKVYSGATCSPSDSNAQFQRPTFNGRIENTSTSASMLVVCPTLKDRMKGDGLVTDGRTAVYVINQNPSVPFSCLLLVYGEDKSVGPIKQQTVSTSTTGSAVQVLAFNASVGGSKGYYHLSCSIPPAVGSSRSSVHAFSVTEKD
jgi:hypothetical protein